jgi:acetate kinase
MTILTVNVGSSSIRLAAYTLNGTCIASVHHVGVQQPAAHLLTEFLKSDAVGKITAVGHRIVHGGARLTASCRITPDVEAEIEKLGPLAPLHNPVELAWVRACRKVLGAPTPQVAVFDTAFYADLPPVARHYALPRALSERLGLRRYGFHGLAHKAMWQRLGKLSTSGRTAGRVISLQLGSGCSITAIRDGKAHDTSMGFSPLEGLVMATRSGDVDPGVLLHIQRTDAVTQQQLEQILDQQSGLLGVSGVSSDLRVLLASAEPLARLAIDLYCYRVRKYLGAYLAVLGGVDAILFGGGVGENLPPIRAKILEGMDWAGIVIEPSLNAAAVGSEARINDATSGVAVWVIPVDESAILVTETLMVLKS